MKLIIRLAAVVVFCYALLLSVTTLQYFFDRGDIRRASEVIYKYQPVRDHSKTLVQIMAKSLNIMEADIHCESQIVARYEGYVQVECGAKANFIPGIPKNFVWQVDLVGARIKPANDKATTLMNQLTGTSHDTIQKAQNQN